MVKNFPKDLLSINIQYKILLIVAQIVLVDITVYLSGGTQYAFTHIMYISVIMAAFLFDIKGTICTAVLAGLTLGPVMPLNVENAEMQQTGSWILRTIFFIVIGLVVNLLLRNIRMENKLQLKKSYEHVITGYPNTNKLRMDLNAMINRQMNFSVIVFKIVNLNSINCYVDYSVGYKVVAKVLKISNDYFDKEYIYSIYTDQIAVVMPNCSAKEARIRAIPFINRFRIPVLVQQFSLELDIKSGVVNYPQHARDVNNLLKEAERTLDQVNENYQIMVYNPSIAYKNFKNYEMAVSLGKAIKKNQFRIVYQPKIDLIKNEIIGYEALLRWDNGKETVDTASFIKIAEDTGFIDDLTKWVVKKAVNQLKQWDGQGIDTNIAVNISSKNLNDKSFMNFTYKYLMQNHVKTSKLEFELTERTLVENEMKARNILNNIKDRGLKISLDDFGTGYNTLIHLVNLPLNYVKIDKSFIDNIQDIRYRPLIQSMIETVQDMGMQVIAEGAETEEQVDLLRDMHCNIVQGYYFSKPIPPEEVQTFLSNFYSNAS